MKQDSQHQDARVPTIGVELIPLREVQRVSGLSRTTIWRRMRDKVNPFPSPAKFSKTCVRWSRREVNDWLQARLSAREAQPVALAA